MHVREALHEGEKMQIRPLDECELKSRVDDVASLVALGNDGAGLSAKAKRQFWYLRNKTKSGTFPMFIGAITMLLYGTIEGIQNMPSDAQSQITHRMYETLLNMDIAQIAKLAQEKGISPSDASGGFQHLLLSRAARADGVA